MLAIWILECLPGIFLKGLYDPSSTLKLMRVSALVGKTPSIFSMRVNIWIADSYLPKLSWWLVFVLWESSSDNLPFCWIGYEQITKTNHSTYLLFHCKAYTPETNIGLEKGWLEDDSSPFRMAYLQGLLLLVSGSVMMQWWNLLF